MSDLREELIRLIKDQIDTSLQVGTVKQVNKGQFTCEVALLENEELVLQVALTLTGEESYVIFVPAPDSLVVVSNANGYYNLVLFSEIESCIVRIGDFSLEIDKTKGFILNEGKLGGLPKIEQLVGKLNAIEQKVNNLQALLTSHVHPASGAVSPTLATLAPLTITQKQDIENPKIKQ